MVHTIIGKRIGMTHVVDDNGNCLPASIVEAGPCTVIRLKSLQSDGYVALQVGFASEQTSANTAKHLVRLSSSQTMLFHHMCEIRTQSTSEYHLGDLIKCDIFEPGQRVKVTRVPNPSGFAASDRAPQKRVTISGLRILSVDAERNRLLIEGPIPETREGVLTIRLA